MNTAIPENEFLIVKMSNFGHQKLKTMRIRERIRDIREQKKYSQEYVATQLGVDPNTYGRWERGETKLEVETLIKIAKVFEVGLADLVEGNGDQIFNIKNNQTVNGNVTNSDASEVKDLYVKLLAEKDKAIQRLEEEIKFLRDQLNRR